MPKDDRARPGAEWLQPDGLGGFASGTVSGIRTRRYHALFLASTTSGRWVLVNGVEAWLDTPTGSQPLTSHLYAPGVRHPDSARRMTAFSVAPWPRWEFRLDDGGTLEHQVMVPRGSATVALSWKLTVAGVREATLRVRPLMSGRSYHATHHENGAFQFSPREESGRLVWRVYDGIPSIEASSNGRYQHAPLWYRQFLYEEEKARGLDDTEDLASPGIFGFDLSQGEAILILDTDADGGLGHAGEGDLPKRLSRLRASERARQGSRDGLERAADAYVVLSGTRKTIIAGYPWFTDWGRDTFISMRGLLLATGRLDDAKEILMSWAPALSCGMLPNYFPDGGTTVEYNAVDAPLWYVVAAGEYLQAVETTSGSVPEADRDNLANTIARILDAYARGTRFGIHADADGLIASGAPGIPLTWMDARVEGRVVTPRRGKAVEIQALWLNAQLIGARWGTADAAGSGTAGRWRSAFMKGRASFISRFWNDAVGGLYDVVDVEGIPGTADSSFRPNQIFAVGGLPIALLDGERARRLVQSVEDKLLTPLGLRSLAPDEPEYVPRYEGGPRERDAVYHQGTVWPWLIGPFVEAWVRARGDTNEARREARRRFLQPLLDACAFGGITHIPEIADAEPPHRAKGCPFQAWSVAEALRLDRVVLAESIRR